MQRLESMGQTLILVAHAHERMEKALLEIAARRCVLPKHDEENRADMDYSEALIKIAEEALKNE